MDIGVLEEAPDDAVIKFPAVAVNESKDALEGGALKTPALDWGAAMNAPRPQLLPQLRMERAVLRLLVCN